MERGKFTVLHQPVLFPSPQVILLAAKWRTYHARQYLLVRASHALSYLPVLLCLTRARGRDFARWRVFMLFLPDALADLAHYADAPLVPRAHYARAR